MTTEFMRERMRSVDAVWLGLDRSTNLMVINGVMLFDEKITYARFRRLCEERLIGPYERFRQRVSVYPPWTGRLYWELDPYFDTRAHLHHIALPEPGDKATLQRLVGELMSESLDRSRPLWRFYLIDNYGDGCAVFGRLHHCIADGTALLQVLLSLTDARPGEVHLVDDDDDTTIGDGEGAGVPHVSERNLLGATAKVAARAASTVSNAVGTVVQEGLQGLASPGDSMAKTRSMGVLAATSAAILAKLLVMSPDWESAYRGELGAIKQVAWCEPLDLQDVKRLGRSTGATVNDVLVAVVTGALRRTLVERGNGNRIRDIRAVVPVNLRTPTDELILGNQFTLVYLALPLSVASPVQRLYEVKRRMDALKRSPEPLVVYRILNLLGAVPGDFAKQATDWFARKASCVLTNVPGPSDTRYFAGRPLRRLIAWVPQSGGIGVGISIFSYAGSVTIGLMVDDGLIPELDTVIEHIHAEYADLSDLSSALATKARASSL